eukprot:RCo042745
MQDPGHTYERKTDVVGENIQHLFEAFLEQFWDEQKCNEVPEFAEMAVFYRRQFAALRQGNNRSTLLVDFQHLHAHDDLLAAAVADRYYRFSPFLKVAASSVYARFALQQTAEAAERREISVAFYNLPEIVKVRQLTTQVVGKLRAICGTVTRTNQVRPELLQGRFQCLDCQTQSDLIEQQFRYTQPVRCRNAACQNTSRWHLLISESKFCDWQKVKVQENSDEIPSGSMPRTLDVILRNDAVEMAKAGDKCIFVGCLIAVPEVAKIFSGVDRREVIRALPGGDMSAPESANPTEGTTGLKMLGVRDLNYRLCFLATTVSLEGEKDGYHLTMLQQDDSAAADSSFTPEENERVDAMRSEPEFLHKMAQCLAPNIWGHDEIKAGILLMLYGGVHKATRDNITLRGDINVCIIGDPSVAKSQFLKYVQQLIPRAIYTSGKASSAAGLTASVIKDVETREFSIEAGALMLADNGLCCIDEFDKMDPDDQVAIHEAMEQQTISIAKAGIKATLNARTSILAAANPIGGRYDPRKPLRHNVGLSPPIMSRFDLFFVVLDEQKAATDRRMAEHILMLHQGGEQSFPTPFSVSDFLLHRRKAKTIHPVLTPEAQRLLSTAFVEMRQNDKSSKSLSYRITTRQLESMVRLSEAVARVYLSPHVTAAHVRLALRVMRSSFVRMEQENIHIPTAGPAAHQKGTAHELSAESFTRMTNILLAVLGRHPKGLAQAELQRQYFDHIPETDENALLREADVVSSVVEHLIEADQVMVASSPEKAVSERILIVKAGAEQDLR